MAMQHVARKLKSIKHEQNGRHYVDDILHDFEQRKVKFHRHFLVIFNWQQFLCKCFMPIMLQDVALVMVLFTHKYNSHGFVELLRTTKTIHSMKWVSLNPLSIWSGHIFHSNTKQSRNGYNYTDWMGASCKFMTAILRLNDILVSLL